MRGSFIKTLTFSSTLLVFAWFLIKCKSKEEISKVDYSEIILVNQIGYLTEAPKKALVKSYSGKFKIIDSEKKVVSKGTATYLGKWKHSGEEYSEIDLGVLNKQGSYFVKLENGGKSFPINVNNNFPEEVCKSALRSFYFNRASIKIDEKYGGIWARPAGHPDDKVIIHETAAGNGRKAGETISSPGGWYDAGDYNKYIVNSAITVYTLLSSYELYSEEFKQMDLKIPESNNGIPDIINETVYNIRWMLTMQDSDGGVYHKLTTKRFEDFLMPHEAVKQRYIMMKSTAATLDFAASMAASSRILSGVEELSTLADSCLMAANAAWQWAEQNPEIFYVQPKGMNTGEYKDTNLTDEKMWASVEMFLATDEASFLDEEKVFSLKFPFTTPSWDLVHTLGLMSIVTHPEKFEDEFIESATKEYLNIVDDLYTIYENSPAITSIDYFKWGSNSDIANQAMLAFIAYNISNETKYAEMGLDNMNYLFGRNPTGYCFVTGFGQKTSINIHHRLAIADGVKEPIPGFLIGGPNTIAMNDCGTEVKRSGFPALSYTDSECSYSTNEIAINWTAPLVFATAAMINYASE